MIGSKKKPENEPSLMYRKVLFDRKSEVFFVTEKQLLDYRNNEIDRIIADHQNNVTTMRHQLELAELISISYDCFYGIQPTNREMSRKSRYPFIFVEYQHVYNDAWIANILRLLNSFKIGQGHWHGYCRYAKMDAIRTVKKHCRDNEKYSEMLQQYEEDARGKMRDEYEKHTGDLLSLAYRNLSK